MTMILNEKESVDEIMLHEIEGCESIERGKYKYLELISGELDGVEVCWYCYECCVCGKKKYVYIGSNLPY